LDISEKAFLPEHKKTYDKYLMFIKKHNLITLDNVGLKEKATLDGETVSIYYKYFDQTVDSPLSTHYEDKGY